MAQFRTRKAALDGILLIDKPEGFTSHDVVARVRRSLRPAVKKVGHAGTLDPFATGLLVVLVGPRHQAGALLRRSAQGVRVHGPVRHPVRHRRRHRRARGQGVTHHPREVEAVLPDFLGTIMQRVPMTSAVKVDGERLYKKAHRGEVVETPVKEVEISAIDVLDFDADGAAPALPHRLLEGHLRQAARDRHRRSGRRRRPPPRADAHGDGRAAPRRRPVPGRVRGGGRGARRGRRAHPRPRRPPPTP